VIGKNGRIPVTFCDRYVSGEHKRRLGNELCSARALRARTGTMMGRSRYLESGGRSELMSDAGKPVSSRLRLLDKSKNSPFAPAATGTEIGMS
jgi:hypothetical protein